MEIFSILDKDHWDVMCMNPGEYYTPITSGGLIIATGSFWIETYLNRRNFDSPNPPERYAPWNNGKAFSHLLRNKAW